MFFNINKSCRKSATSGPFQNKIVYFSFSPKIVWTLLNTDSTSSELSRLGCGIDGGGLWKVNFCLEMTSEKIKYSKIIGLCTTKGKCRSEEWFEML